MPRVLLLSNTTGYQAKAFADAAARLGVEVVWGTDRCKNLPDPWRDGAIPLRWHLPRESADALVHHLRTRPVDGIVVLGDSPTVTAAHASRALGLAWHPPGAAQASRNKLEFRKRLRENGLNVPDFRAVPIDADPGSLLRLLRFPVVVKPLALSGSRGVIRADTDAEFLAAFARVRRLLLTPQIRAMRDENSTAILIEEFVEGGEFALEGLFDGGRLRVLALFDKPDPLDGPFFEETLYVTPSRLEEAVQRRIIESVEQAGRALGFARGPVHAEIRLNRRGPFVLEAGARPIGGLCARALRFIDTRGAAGRPVDPSRGGGDLISLEELVLRHALGDPLDTFVREERAAGVMMIPIPQAGILRDVEGIEEAEATPHVEEVRITAKRDEQLVPLPEGASYLGFIFARAGTPQGVERALRAAHSRLQIVFAPALTVVR